MTNPRPVYPTLPTYIACRSCGENFTRFDHFHRHALPCRERAMRRRERHARALRRLKGSEQLKRMEAEL